MHAFWRESAVSRERLWCLLVAERGCGVCSLSEVLEKRMSLKAHKTRKLKSTGQRKQQARPEWDVSVVGCHAPLYSTPLG